MRLMTSLLMAALVSQTTAAPTTNPSTPPAPSPADAQAAAELNSPVSLSRIRNALEQPSTPALLPTTNDLPTPALLPTTNDLPTFRVEIRERMKIEDLLSTWHF